MFARIFIPKKHRQRFDEAVSQNMINRLCRSKSISEPQGRIRRSRSEDHSDRRRGSKRASSVPRDGGEPEREKGLRKSGSGVPTHPPLGPSQRMIRVYRGKKSFGFTLRGHAPVCIDSVIPGTSPRIEHSTVHTSQSAPVSAWRYDPNAPMCWRKRGEDAFCVGESVVVAEKVLKERSGGVPGSGFV
ncbi:Delphilin [Characodon lateralis]|uniref:Delphilin n=3 Tax=Goodeidae TaxID=28758 RepID=A0ABU7D2K2_9TELE|nr:Delphilin [Characodon lateralis]